MLKYAALLPLLSKTVVQLSLDDLLLVKDTLNINVEITQELKDATTAFLLGKDIDKVSDLISSPESIQQLVTFFGKQKAAGSPPEQIIVRCPHCENFFLTE